MTSMKPPTQLSDLCVIGNALVSPHEAVLPVANTELEYGFGVYETLRVENGVLYFAAQHVDRLQFSAAHIGLTHALSTESITRSINMLVAAGVAIAPTFNVKVLLIGGKTADEAQLYVFASSPLFVDRKLYRDGCDVITQRVERPFPQAKTLSMLQSYVAHRAAKEAGAYDALLVNHAGHVTEGTRTNVFFVQGNTLITPPQEQILEGVTKRVLHTLCAQHGITIEERAVTLEQALAMDGAFLTSTSTKVLPIRTIDGNAYSHTPPLTKQLMELYADFWQQSGGVTELTWTNTQST